MEVIIESQSIEETQSIAESLGGVLEAGDVLALIGQMGAGKTCFVQGLAKGCGVEDPVTSPSFVLVKEYPGRLTVAHADLFRLEGVAETVSVGLEEYYDPNMQAVTVIEWANQIPDVLPDHYLEVQFEVVDEDCRRLKFRPVGDACEARLQSLQEVLSS